MTATPPDYPHPPDVDEHDLGALLADRQTLRNVTDELVECRLVLAQVRAGLSDRAPKSLQDGAYWVRLSRSAALALLNHREGAR